MRTSESSNHKVDDEEWSVETKREGVPSHETCPESRTRAVAGTTDEIEPSRFKRVFINTHNVVRSQTRCKHASGMGV